MKIAVVSDSHDHIWHIRRAVSQANDMGAEVLIHCGDLISPFMLEELDAFLGRIHLILGNNCGDQVLLMKRLSSRKEHVNFHGWFGEVNEGGLNMAFVHAPDLAQQLARTGSYDMVFFGHTHLWHMEDVNGTTLLNPGEIMGKKETAGWALIDTATREVQHITIEDATARHASIEGVEPDLNQKDTERDAKGTETPDSLGQQGEHAEMLLHVRPDLYRACMRCIWMLIHEEGMTPLEAQNTLMEEFLKHHGC